MHGMSYYVGSIETTQCSNPKCNINVSNCRTALELLTVHMCNAILEQVLYYGRKGGFTMNIMPNFDLYFIFASAGRGGFTSQ